jgi:hypothetical protein
MPTAKDFLIRLIPSKVDSHVQRVATGDFSDEEGFYVVLEGTASVEKKRLNLLANFVFSSLQLGRWP